MPITPCSLYLTKANQTGYSVVPPPAQAKAVFLLYRENPLPHYSEIRTSPDAQSFIKQFVLKSSISCLVIDLWLLGVAFLNLSKLVLIVILSQYSLINLL